MTKVLLESYAEDLTFRQHIRQSAFAVTEATRRHARKDSCCNAEVKPSIMLKLQLGQKFSSAIEAVSTALQTADSML